MRTQHDITPNAPQEAPLEWGNPEVLEPQDPGTPTMPEESPDNEPTELPEQPGQPEAAPAETGKF